MNDGMPRRYAAELVGTFGIVFAPVALSSAAGLRGAEGGLMAAAWVSGLAVLAMIYALGHISAAHFNPAVTLGFAVAGRFPWRYFPAYVLAQLTGSPADLVKLSSRVAPRISVLRGHDCSLPYLALTRVSAPGRGVAPGMPARTSAA